MALQDTSSLKRFDEPTLADRAFAMIEEMIVDRQLQPGQMISENELGDALGLGRTPVREAIARLKYIGFVEVHRRRGILVSALDPFKHLELLEVRQPLERDLVRHAVERASEEELRELNAVMTKLREAAASADRSRYFVCKRELHQVEVRAAKNSVLTATMASLHAQSRRFWQAYEPTSSFLKAANLHGEIASSIVAREGEGAAAGVDALFTFLQHLTTLILRRQRFD
jgi:DNA-binding GntR family transcriptional regulator